jgi:hypothetical protein
VDEGELKRGMLFLDFRVLVVLNIVMTHDEIATPLEAFIDTTANDVIIPSTEGARQIWSGTFVMCMHRTYQCDVSRFR